MFSFLIISIMKTTDALLTLKSSHGGRRASHVDLWIVTFENNDSADSCQLLHDTTIVPTRKQMSKKIWLENRHKKPSTWDEINKNPRLGLISWSFRKMHVLSTLNSNWSNHRVLHVRWWERAKISLADLSFDLKAERIPLTQQRPKPEMNGAASHPEFLSTLHEKAWCRSWSKQSQR